MTGDLRFDWYHWRGGREAMLRFGPDRGPLAIAALPLFEEANRTRTFVVAVLRALAACGIGSVLPDIPGQGESLLPLETVSLADMRCGFAAAAARVCRGRRGYAITIRSGALLDGEASVAGRWRLARQDGPALLRELRRITGHARSIDAATPVEIAGNPVTPAFLAELERADVIGPERSVRLSGDPAAADRTIEGTALWRRSEPGHDPAMAESLAGDIADWIARCEG